MNKAINQIIQGDALQVLKSFPGNYVQTVITSPPYFGLRQYLPDGHPDKRLEIGSEETPEEYVAKMVEVFREVRRVLRSDGTAWINIGETSANDKKFGGHSSGKHRKALHSQDRKRRYTGLPGKNILGIPWRVALALQADGWILRQEIIWNKPNCMPESVDDRPTRSHEYIFLLTKKPHYFYDAEAIKEPASYNTHSRGNGIHPKTTPTGSGVKANGSFEEACREVVSSRNKRSVWSVAEPLCRLRHDLTDEQRSYVVGELLRRELL